MFCIAAFIILSILGIFSARYRKLAGRAWGCVAKKLTFRACDIRFDEEIKGKLLGKLVLRRPKLAKFLSRWIDLLAFIFVVLSVWSIIVVASSLLNLFVYDTCNPSNAESCSLGGEACGITSGGLTFYQALSHGQILSWTAGGFKDFGTTLERIPDRLKTWNPSEYIPAGSNYYGGYDVSKPAALEIIDPMCTFCAKMFSNIKTASFERKYNLAYLAYPIPNPSGPGGYKFKNSYLVARYLEALRGVKMTSTEPGDWALLEYIFTGKNGDGSSVQQKMRDSMTEEEAIQAIHAFLLKSGLSEVQIRQIDAAANSDAAAQGVASARRIVEDRIHTIKIPTIMFDGRRYDRVLPPEKLK